MGASPVLSDRFTCRVAVPPERHKLLAIHPGPGVADVRTGVFHLTGPPMASAPLSGPAGQRRAFTLVELLVVIGIIALLISILIPTLGRARDQAQRTKCMANLKSLTEAWVQYANDHKGRLVRAETYAANPAAR